MPGAKDIAYTSHTALYRHHKAIRTRLACKLDRRANLSNGHGFAKTASAIVDTRSDVFSLLVEQPIRLGSGLPVFGTLYKIAEQAHAAAKFDLHSQMRTTPQ